MLKSLDWDTKEAQVVSDKARHLLQIADECGKVRWDYWALSDVIARHFHYATSCESPSVVFSHLLGIPLDQARGLWRSGGTRDEAVAELRRLALIA